MKNKTNLKTYIKVPLQDGWFFSKQIRIKNANESLLIFQKQAKRLKK